MDFTLALTHFCEAHGPKSVLCTQVLPLECALCLPPSPPLRACSSESLTTQVHDSSFDSNQSHHTTPLIRKSDTNFTLPTDFSGASTTVDSETEPESPTIEKHPLFQQKRESSSQWPYGRAQGDTCASCSFSVPKAVAEKIPAGAPGSKRSIGKDSTSAPVLRSREFVCLRRSRSSSVNHDSKPSSYSSSFASSRSHTRSIPHSNSGDCHDHTLTYLTAKSPDDPEGYAQLRASVIRTLSCELLPRGMSDGPFCFGDSDTGYTISYVFRLTDPRARGRRRAYAFVALAGKDASRAFQACPMLWEAFASMAKGIEAAAQRHLEEQRQKAEEEAQLAESRSSRNYTPVSSFLTARTVDPDGHPRRAGQATPRSLAEIVGDENIFAYLHQYFVAILRCLGDRFGGLPLAGKPSVYQSLSDELPRFAKTSAVENREQSISLGQLESLRDEDTTPTPHMPATGQTPTWLQMSSAPITASREHDDLEVAKTRANQAFKLNPQCAPLAVSETAQRQVVV
ncbi:hypothetical protein LTS15_004674 [Exophiala xenobiotica]|nr:hypothetical protein LTS15_004674 [Exophiala xenobiotica]